MNWEIHHAKDSFRVLAELPDESVDVVITDPPYDAHVQSNMMSGTTLKRVELPFAALTNDTRRGLAYHLPRIARRWALAFCTLEDFGALRDVNPKQWVRAGVWYKPNSMGQLTGDRPAVAYEGIAIMHRSGKKHWQGRGSFAYWSADFLPSEEAHYVCNGTRGEKERHPNQKPLALALELVAKFSVRGETIFDPFCGSGRIGEACMLLGRRYLGLDNDPEWVAKAKERLARSETAAAEHPLTDEQCWRLCAAPKNPKPNKAA
jgi:DNA modification methylase